MIDTTLYIDTSCYSLLNDFSTSDKALIECRLASILWRRIEIVDLSLVSRSELRIFLTSNLSDCLLFLLGCLILLLLSSFLTCWCGSLLNVLFWLRFLSSFSDIG